VKMFLEAQGYHVCKTFLEQDNESAIKLEKNGRTSAGPKSRHISNIRYFWIKDRTRAERITIRHCPTPQMLADFFTKPLQGTLFRTLRDVIPGYMHVDALAINVVPLPSAEERVGTRRLNVHGTKSSTKDTDTKHNSTVTLQPQPRELRKLPEVTWADVVRRTPVAAGSTKDNKAVVSRSFSQSKNKV
jgi:hypothetical protein